MVYPPVKDFIAGQFVGSGQQCLDVFCPSDGRLLSTVPLSGMAELDAAVVAAQAALPKWAATPIKEPLMSTPMNRDELRTALENAIKGKSANKSPFSLAWAEGSLSREHLARWAENHYHYVGPFADYLAYIYARTPDHMTDAKDFLLANMYEEEIGGDRHCKRAIATRIDHESHRHFNHPTRGRWHNPNLRTDCLWQL